MSNARRYVEITVKNSADVKRVLNSLEKSAKNTERSVSDLKGQVGNLGNSLRALAGAVGVRELFTLADAAKDVTTRLISVSGSVEAGEAIFERLLSISNRLGVGINEMASSYTKLKVSIEGVTTEKLIKGLDTVSSALATTGATTQQVNAVLLQMSQALSSGALQGDEFRSVYENAPVLLRAWKDAIGESESNLRDLSSQAKLTTASFYENIEAIDASVKAFTGMEKPADTIARALVALKNNTISFLYEFQKAVPIFDLVSAAIKLAANNMDLLSAAIIGVSVAWAAVKLANAARFLSGAFVEALAAARAGTIALAAVSSNLAVVLGVAVVGAAFKAGEAIHDYIASWDDLEDELEDNRLLIEQINRLGFESFNDADLQILDKMIIKYEDLRSVLVRQITEHEKHNSALTLNYTAYLDAQRELPGLRAALENLEVAYGAATFRADGLREAQEKLAKSTSSAMIYTQGLTHQLYAADQKLRIFNSSGQEGLDQLEQTTAGTKEYIKTVAELTKQQEKARNGDKLTLEQIHEIARLNQAVMVDIVKTEHELTESQKEFRDGVRESEKLEKRVAKTRISINKEQIKSDKDLVREKERLYQAYLNAYHAVDELAGIEHDHLETVRELEAALAAGVIEQEDFVHVLELTAAAHDKNVESLKGNTEELNAFGEKVKTTEELLLDAAKSMTNAIQTGIAGTIEGMLTGTLDSAKDFIKSLKDLLIKGIANIAAQMLTNEIVVPIAGQVLGTAGAAGGAGGSASFLSNLFNNKQLGENLGKSMAEGFGKIFEKDMPNWIQGGVEKFGGAVVMGGSTLVGTTIGNAVFGGSSEAQIGAAVGSAAGAAIGGAVASGSAIAAGAIAGSVVPIIGTLVGAILGALAGGALGSMLGGGGDKPQAALALSHGKLAVLQEREIDGAGMASLNEAINGMNELLDSMAMALGPEAAAAREQQSIGGVWVGAQDIDTGLRIAFSKAANAMVNATTGATGAIIKEIYSEAAGDMEQFTEQFNAFNSILNSMANSINSISPNAIRSGEEMAQVILDMGLGAAEAVSGGLAEFANMMESLKTESELLKEATMEVEDVFRQLGITMPTTSQGFMDLYDSVDVTTIAGIELAAALGNISPSLELMVEDLEDLEEAASNLRDTVQETTREYYRARQEFIDSYKSETQVQEEALEGLRDVFSEFGEELPDTIEGLYDMLTGLDLATKEGEAFLSAIIENETLIDAAYELMEQRAEDAASATEDLANAQQDLIDAYQSVFDAIQDNIAATYKNIEEFGLTPEELYNRRKEEADKLMEALKLLTDPQEILDTVNTIDQLINEGWGLLDEGQKAILQEEFLSYLDEVNELANDRLQIGLDQGLDEIEAENLLADTVGEFVRVTHQLDGSLGLSSTNMVNAGEEMRQAASAMQTAAVAMQTAANTYPTSVTVRVEESEVG